MDNAGLQSGGDKTTKKAFRRYASRHIQGRKHSAPLTPQHRKIGALRSVPNSRRHPPQSGDSLVNRLWSAATWAATHHQEKKHREARASPVVPKASIPFFKLSNF